MPRLFLVCVAALFAVQAGLDSQQAETGVIAGRVSDPGGGVLPGATITASTGDVKRTTVSDARGTYRFDNLPPGAYRLQGELAGFRRAVAESIPVTAGVTTTHDVMLRLGLLVIVDYVLPDGIVGALREAAIVVHLEITQSLGTRLRNNESWMVTEHRAKVLAVVKTDREDIVVGKEILFDQDAAGDWLENGQRSVGIETPYRPGLGFVAFLRRNPDSTLREFAGTNYMWPASKGFVIIESPGGVLPPGLRGRMTVEECLAVLRKLDRARAARPDPVPRLHALVEARTGAGAIDCGQHLLRQTGKNSVAAAEADVLQRSLDCVLAAARQGKAFWTFEQLPGIDSWIAEGMLGKDGAVLLFFYDDDPSGGSGAPASFTVQRCDAPRVVSDRGGPRFRCRTP